MHSEIDRLKAKTFLSNNCQDLSKEKYQIINFTVPIAFTIIHFCLSPTGKQIDQGCLCY
jgi:hypothetical protein